MHEATPVVHVVGDLAEKPPGDDRVLEGLLVHEKDKMQFMAAEDLERFTGLKTINVLHKQVTVRLVNPADIVRKAIPFSGSFDSLRFLLEVLFEGIQYAENVTETESKGRLSLNDLVYVTHMKADPQTGPSLNLKHRSSFALETEEHLLLEWESGNLADTLADAVVAAVLQVPCPTPPDPNHRPVPDARRRERRQILSSRAGASRLPL